MTTHKSDSYKAIKNRRTSKLMKTSRKPKVKITETDVSQTLSNLLDTSDFSIFTTLPSIYDCCIADIKCNIIKILRYLKIPFNDITVRYVDNRYIIKVLDRSNIVSPNNKVLSLYYHYVTIKIYLYVYPDMGEYTLNLLEHYIGSLSGLTRD